MVVIIVSKRLVSLGRKLCLFVNYVKHVDNKQWVAKDIANISMERRSKTLHDNIRKGVQGQKKGGLLVWLSLLWNM